VRARKKTKEKCEHLDNVSTSKISSDLVDLTISPDHPNDEKVGLTAIDEWQEDIIVLMAAFQPSRTYYYAANNFQHDDMSRPCLNCLEVEVHRTKSQ
jgi:hypothetical protein